MKTEVYQVAEFLGVTNSILIAKPTDGLWGDDRSDEDQIGASYPELEWAMDYIEDNGGQAPNLEDPALTDRQKTVLSIYWRMNRANQHKMRAIPVCSLSQLR
jgi:NAD+ synthase